MALNGVSKNGGRISLGSGLSLELPYGAAWDRKPEGDKIIYYLDPIPDNYREGSFETDADGEGAYSLLIRGISIQQEYKLSPNDGRELTPESVKEILEMAVENAARAMTGDGDEEDEDEITDGEYEWRSHTQVDEDDDGNISIRSDLSMEASGGSYELLDTPDHVAAALVQVNMQLFGSMSVPIPHICLAVASGDRVVLATSMVTFVDEDDVCLDLLTKLVSSAQLTRARVLPPRDARRLLEKLDWQQAEKVSAGELRLPVPKCLQSSTCINSDARLLTLLDEGLDPDDDSWADACALSVSLQKPVPLPESADMALDSDEGRKLIRKVLDNLNIFGQHLQFRTAVLTGDLHILCTTSDSEPKDASFFYLVFTHKMLYSGQFIGRKAGLGKTGDRRWREELKKFLGQIDYDPHSGCLDRLNREALGEFAGADGRLDAVAAAALFFRDLFFFHQGDFSWDGSHTVFGPLQINAAKLDEYDSVQKNPRVFSEAVRALMADLEQNEDLRVPAAQLGQGLRDFLKGGDLTGSMLFHLAGYHQFIFQPDDSGGYQLLMDGRMEKNIPDAGNYFRKFLTALRAWNGLTAPVSLEVLPSYRAVDVPDIFHDGGPCIEPDGGPDSEEDIAKALREANIQEMKEFPYDSCAVEVPGHAFVLSGEFAHDDNDREQIAQRIRDKGGRTTQAVSGVTDYLVLGSYGDYGEKKLKTLRANQKAGKPGKVISEDMLFTALEAETPPEPTFEERVAKLQQQISEEQDRKLAEKEQAKQLERNRQRSKVQELRALREKDDKVYARESEKVFARYEPQAVEQGLLATQSRQKLYQLQNELKATGFLKFGRKRELNAQIAQTTAALEQARQERDRLIAAANRELEDLHHKCYKVSADKAGAMMSQQVYELQEKPDGHTDPVALDVLSCVLSDIPQSLSDVRDRMLNKDLPFRAISSVTYSDFVRKDSPYFILELIGDEVQRNKVSGISL